MKINQITESTVAGSVATVAMPMGEMQKRVKASAKKTKKKYQNSLHEGRVKELSMDLKELTDKEFNKKYGKTKQEWSASLKKKDSEKPVSEAELQEDDLILVPGQGFKRRTGFVPHDPDRAEHEGQTLKNSLHTIIRTATHLNKELSERDNFPEWVSEKIGTIKGMMVSVMDYLISDKEMYGQIRANEMTGGVVAGGGVGESIAMESVGYENLKAIKYGAEEGREAEIKLGDETVVLDYPEVRFIHGFIRQAMKDNRLDDFLKILSDPYKFHMFMKKRGDMLYRNRDVGSSQATADRLALSEKFASQQQAKLMYAVAGDKDVAKKTGVSQKVAKEFIKKSHGQKVKKLPKKVKKD